MSKFNTALVAELFSLLGQIEMDLPLRGPSSDAVRVIHSLIALNASLQSLEPSARDAGLLKIVELICPLYLNGIGDSIIWPALRRAQLHTLSERFTAHTNLVRAELSRIKQLAA